MFDFPLTAYGEVEQPDIAETPSSKHQMVFAESRDSMPGKLLCWLVVKRKTHHYFLGYFFQDSINGKREREDEDDANVLV